VHDIRRSLNPVFAAASVLAAWADTAAVVIAARAVMGIGAAIILPVAFAVLPALFAPPERSKAVALVVVGTGRRHRPRIDRRRPGHRRPARHPRPRRQRPPRLPVRHDPRPRRHGRHGGRQRRPHRATPPRETRPDRRARHRGSRDRTLSPPRSPGAAGPHPDRRAGTAAAGPWSSAHQGARNEELVRNGIPLLRQRSGRTCRCTTCRRIRSPSSTREAMVTGAGLARAADPRRRISTDLGQYRVWRQSLSRRYGQAS
jgi:hypothetical protein